jgi:hypothetical protein
MQSMLRGIRLKILTGLMVTLLLEVNMAHPVASASYAIVPPTSGCSMDSVRGGWDWGSVNWVGAIDGGCAAAGLGSVFFAANPVGLAFCAGWGVGRFIDGYIYGS